MISLSKECRSCGYQNIADAEVCKECGATLIEADKDFVAPLKMLRELISNIRTQGGSFTRDKINMALSHIIEVAHEIMDKTRSILEENLAKMEKIPEELKEELGEGLSEEEALSIFTNYVNRFHQAQEFINEGFEIVKDALGDLKTFTSEEFDTLQKETEIAIEMLERGFYELEIITEETFGKLYTTFIGEEEDILPIHDNLPVAMQTIESIMKALNEYIEDRDTEALKSALPELDKLKELINTIVKEEK